MSRFVAISLRAQLFVITVLVALPAVGIILYSGFRQRCEAISEARIETQRLAENIAAEQQTLVSSAKQLLSALAQLPAVKKFSRAEVDPILNDILKINPQYLNIFIADAQGIMRASAVPMKAPFSVRDRRYFTNVMTTGRFSSGECIVGRIFGKPTVTFGYPIRKATGECDGVIAVNFDLDYCARLLQRSKLPTGTSYALIDHKGMVLSRGIDPAPFVGKPDNPERFKAMRDGPEKASYMGLGLAGDRRYITYRKLRLEGEPTPYMYVRAGIPVVTVLAKANAAMLRDLGLLTPFLVLAFLLAWLIGKRSIVDRVAVLEAASLRVAAGDLQVRVAEVVKGGELGRLGRSFDEMAAALHRDVSERKRQEETLQMKAAVLESMTEGVSECTPDGIIRYTNPAFEEMYGYEKGELLGKPMTSLTACSPAENDVILRDIATHLTGKRIWSGEFVNRKKNGTTFDTCARISEVASNQQWVVVQEDITERKTMERMKDEILSAVSHEMRTPLTALLGFNQFLLENDVSGAQRREYLGIMYKETKRLNELIGNFLDLQRMRAREAFCSFRPIEVKALLESSAAHHASACNTHRVRMEPLPEMPRVLGDETNLHQVLCHLVDNAIKFSPGGGDIILGAECRERNVVISVSDHGVGIPSHLLEKVFDRFYRVNNSDSRPVGGAGLGLALTREIVRTHGGSVWVESTLDEGSTFYVSLPLAKTAVV